LGTTIIAASVDTGEKAQEMADSVNYPVAQGVTRAMADSIGAWWEDRRSIIQPSEFILNREGGVVTSMYTSGPGGRIAADTAVRMVTFWRSQ
jgi:hypothetical protein